MLMEETPAPGHHFNFHMTQSQQSGKPLEQGSHRQGMEGLQVSPRAGRGGKALSPEQGTQSCSQLGFGLTGVQTTREHASVF
jgi:hypothetical protein